jgi:hypothetical protein
MKRFYLLYVWNVDKIPRFWNVDNFYWIYKINTNKIILEIN